VNLLYAALVSIPNETSNVEDIQRKLVIETVTICVIAKNVRSIEVNEEQHPRLLLNNLEEIKYKDKGVRRFVTIPLTSIYSPTSRTEHMNKFEWIRLSTPRQLFKYHGSFN